MKSRVPEKLFSPFDGALILVIIALAVLLPFIFTKSRSGDTLCITYDGKASYYTLQLDRELELESRGIKLKAVIRSGEAFVEHSECDDKICESSGKISRGGEVIVCAPAGVVLHIVDGERLEGGADVVLP